MNDQRNLSPKSLYNRSYKKKNIASLYRRSSKQECALRIIIGPVRKIHIMKKIKVKIEDDSLKNIDE